MEDNEEETQINQTSEKEVTPQGETTDDTGERKPLEKSLSKLDEAKEIAERIDKGNKALTENIARLEKLQAEELLGGKSSGGQIPEKPKAMT